MAAGGACHGDSQKDHDAQEIRTQEAGSKEGHPEEDDSEKGGPKEEHPEEGNP
jgi:hypothetical protein